MEATVMPKVRIIAPTKGRAAPAVAKPVLRKVAGYARVSTDQEEQQTSYAAQVDYYTKYIQARADWTLVKVYTDEGVTGTSTRHREGFQEMVKDALDGKIDLIVTKSVSRFARNTVDSLTTIRQLKEHGTEVFFEKENIWTFDGKGELLITIMSSLAQEESRSISENVRWGHRKKFSDGKFSLNYKQFLGYDKGPDGKLVINPEQAVVVRRIYSLFLEGNTPYQIAQILTDEGIPTPTGKSKWRYTTVRSILENETYAGDKLLQKTYSVDFLSKTRLKNHGEVQQYLVEGDHEAIIKPDTFKQVQAELKRRIRSRVKGVSVFCGRIVCGDCGQFYGPKVWHSNDQRYRKVVWNCNDKCKGVKCTTPNLKEPEIRAAFERVLVKLAIGKEERLANLREIQGEVADVSALEAEKARLDQERADNSAYTQKEIIRNTALARNQDEYNKRYDECAEKDNKLNSQIKELEAAIQDKLHNARRMAAFIDALAKADEEYSDELWCAMVDKATVYSKGKIVFTLTCGTEVEV